MKLWDKTFATPAENLAADEALLDACEAGGPNVLRFWEPADYFVVLGFSNAAARETNLAACHSDNIPVLRRCSGGGAVLQGPGCLNYSLALRLDSAPDLETIPGSNRYIMLRNRHAVSAALGASVEVQGITDLCLGPKKFSGNSQRRLRHALLFHGTFLLNFDLERIPRYLAMPSHQPVYRADRSHLDFVTTISCDAKTIRRALMEAWDAREPLELEPDLGKLVSEKYSRADWNLKY